MSEIEFLLLLFEKSKLFSVHSMNLKCTNCVNQLITLAISKGIAIGY